MPTTLQEALQIIQQLRAEIATLTQQVDELTTRLTQGERKNASPQIKASVTKAPAKPRRKRDPQHNRGRKRQEPTRVEVHAHDHCPDCGRTLQGGSIARTRQVLDLPPPPPVEVVEHQFVTRYCPHCSAWKTPTPAVLTGQILGQSRVGVRIAAMIAYLRTTLRLPIRRIQEYLATMHHFPVSIGEITRLLHQVRHTLDGDVEQIKTQARASPILHADETGWRENGRNGYIWSLSTHGEAAVRWYTYDHSRASGVIKRLLAGRFTGHLVSDFYAGYNSYPGQHQRCWVHLLRDLRDLQKPYPLPEGTPLPGQPQAGEDLAIAVHRWTDAVRALYTTAKQWLADHPSPTLAAREAEYQRLMTQSHQLGLQYITPTTHPCRTLGQRLLRHEGELFQFVLVDGLAADNNPAERSVRHIVIMRKISGGSRSTEGTTTRMALASLFGTWQARGLNPFEECFHRLSTPIPQPT